MKIYAWPNHINLTEFQDHRIKIGRYSSPIGRAYEIPISTKPTIVLDVDLDKDEPVLVVQYRKTWIICQDNGMPDLLNRFNQEMAEGIWELKNSLSLEDDALNIMHAIINFGTPEKLVRPTANYKKYALIWSKRYTDHLSGKVIFITDNGDIITNIGKEDLNGGKSFLEIRSGDKLVIRKRKPKDNIIGEPIAYLDKSGLVMLSIPGDNASERLNYNVGDNVLIHRGYRIPRKMVC
jgi:S-adenosylmethionine hydrolase